MAISILYKWMTIVLIVFISRQAKCLHIRRHLRPQRIHTARFVLTTPESIIEQVSTTNLLDDLIDESTRTSARRPIIMQFNPSSGWIWKRWKGTVFSETWDSCVVRMLYASIIFLLCQRFPQIKNSLSGFSTLWGQLLSVTTFTLTFFVNQSYSLWRKCTELSRRLQGRLHDLDMSLAAHATRKQPSLPNEPSIYTAASRQLLEVVSRYVRLFNILTYASFTRSHRPILTPRGMRRLVERGLMTPLEREILIEADIPATQRHNAVLLWIMRCFIEGRSAGLFVGDAGFESEFLEKAHVCRASYGAIGDELQGRMPLAYAHIVQVLVDLVLWMYPFMAYSSGFSGFLCVLGTGLLTIGYQGLFDLAKQFLDPYDNESYGKGEDPLVVDTLIAETNAGSVRWMHGLEKMPVSSQKIVDGELSDYILPLRGYSVVELLQMEEEKLEQQKIREKEEKERKLIEEQQRRINDAANAMVPAMFDPACHGAALFSKDLKMVTSDSAFAESIFGGFASASFSMARTVSIFVSLQNSTLWQKIVPQSTAPEPDHALQDVSKENESASQQERITTEPERTRFGGADFNVDERHQANDDFVESKYIHVFEAFDPYLDLPAYEEIGLDGKEIRLSKILADEVWKEELEFLKEKKAVTSYEEFLKRADELRVAEATELQETEEILKAMPGSLKRNDDKPAIKEEPQVYDQTKLDGMSQMFGIPPDILSEMPSYEKPPSPLSSIENVWKLWGASTLQYSSLNEAEVAQPGILETDIDAFEGISQLWGQDFDDESEQALSSTATRSVAQESVLSSAATRRATASPEVTSGDVNLSQLLADEVWDYGDSNVDNIKRPVTYEDYVKQVQQILETEKKELIETEAILNAPPGADSVAALENESDVYINAKGASAIEQITKADPEPSAYFEHPTVALTSSNETEYSLIDYAENLSHQGGQMSDSEKKEMMETEAILNAPPGADTVELPLEESTVPSLVINSTLRTEQTATGSSDKPKDGEEILLFSTDFGGASQEIVLDSEKEKAETEAILNAPPGADSVNMPEGSNKTSTVSSLDDLSVLDMDAPEEVLVDFKGSPERNVELNRTVTLDKSEEDSLPSLNSACGDLKEKTIDDVPAVSDDLQDEQRR